MPNDSSERSSTAPRSRVVAGHAPGAEVGLVSGAALGLAAGFASSFLGIGGGLVMVPALATWAGFPIKRAIGTSLAAIVPVAAAGVLVESFVKGENIHWAVAALLAAGSLAGTYAGARLLDRSPARRLRWLLVALLLLSAIRLSGVTGLLGGATGAAPFASPLAGAGFAACLLLGVGGGVSSSLFGIGGGIVVVPGLSILFAEFAFHGARATSLATIVPTSIASAWLHTRLGTIDWAAVKRIVPAALAGSVAGVILANRLPEAPLRLSFCLFLVAASARLIRPAPVTSATLPAPAPAPPPTPGDPVEPADNA